MVTNNENQCRNNEAETKKTVQKTVHLRPGSLRKYARSTDHLPN